MSKVVQQPIGQKRLTNVAVVRLKKKGIRFEIACYKNKVLSWRSGVEKDLDEVLQSHTVYSNVSKGILAKSKELEMAFGKERSQTEICLEVSEIDHPALEYTIQILDKGELQIAGKERESQLSSQFRDIATIVMQKTINPETKRPYTISMIERLMHEIHFAVDPNSSSKKQALEVIRELQKHFPIKRCPMRLRLIVPEQNFSSLLEKLNVWNPSILSKDESGGQLSIICEMEPSIFRDCDALVRNLQGRLEILAVSVHVDHYDDHENVPSGLPMESADPVLQLIERVQIQTVSVGSSSTEGDVKQNKCSTCDTFVGDSEQYREHFKSEWHKHNLRRKTRQLPPLSAEECMTDMEIGDFEADLKDYSF